METSSPSEQALTLSELNYNIRQALRGHFAKAIWVVAEISEIKVNASGHCYLELVEKDTANDKILAKSRANIWAYSFRLLKPYFETTARRSLEAGLKIMILVQVEFHEVYGLSLNITDIDPNYTLGDMARQRAEAIAKLQADGVYEMNKNLELPLVLQKIAIISSATAAGYEDFCKHLLQNDYGFYFQLKLFPAVMQGEEAVESIISALEKINSHIERYETVVIIRGGGSQLDLSCFDNYWLASHVAQFPLPVFTGIGHEQDESVTDLVAHSSMKTPTAVADYILSKSIEIEGYLQELKSQFTEFVMHRLSDENSKLMVLSLKFGPRINSILQKKEKELVSFYGSLRLEWEKLHRKTVSQLALINLQSRNSMKVRLNRTEQKLTFLFGRLKPLYRGYFKIHNLEINNLNELIETLNPQNILKRGFSITYHNGKPLHNLSNVQSGDVIENKLEKGWLESKITKIDKTRDKKI
jgi:exodeoxyribonuclease VII large subunit